MSFSEDESFLGPREKTLRSKRQRKISSSTRDSDSEQENLYHCRPAPTPFANERRRRRLPPKKSPALLKLELKRANYKARKRLAINVSGVSINCYSSGTGETVSNFEVDSVATRGTEHEDLQDLVYVNSSSDSDIDLTEPNQNTERRDMLTSGEDKHSTDELSDFIDDSDATGALTSYSQSQLDNINDTCGILNKGVYRHLEREHRIFIQYHLSLILDPSFDKCKVDYYCEAIQKIVDKIQDSQRIVKSQAWAEGFHRALEQYPDLQVHHDENWSYGGRCEACNKPGRNASRVLIFSGRRYEREEVRKEDDDEEEQKEQFDVGRFCALRSRLYHSLCHYERKLREKCQERISSFDADEHPSFIVNKCLDNEFWMSERYEKFCRLVDDASKYYTSDGRGQQPSSSYY